MRKLFLVAALMGTISLAAQETYENAKLVGDDLNGTARYIGLGGAMEALGADLSTIGSNPAGLGLFRHSTASLSGSLVIQSGAPGYASGDKTRASFDQAGFVYALKTGDNSFLNFGINYHKSKNFSYILAAADGLNNASQNKLSYQKARNGVTPNHDERFNQVDYLYRNTDLYDPQNDVLYNEVATGYCLNREHKGYIADYDFNVSGNIHDRVYLGVTFGVKDVNYKHYGTYREYGTHDITLYDDREIEGTGFNIKAGLIARPFDNSPFRFGFYVHTPTWYDLETSNRTRLEGLPLNEKAKTNSNREIYEYNINTPWVFGLSLGHTIGKQLALGATYEYADYGSTKTRIKDGHYYDGWNSYDETSNDHLMNHHTSATLKGVSTLKLGAEYKPVKDLALRVGYNFMSPKYSKDGFKDGTINSPGSYYSSATDYTNWKAINRFTCGVGYQIKSFNIDLAYQYSAQKGDFYPFMSYYDNEDPNEDNIAGAKAVKNNRSQLMLTVGYHF